MSSTLLLAFLLGFASCLASPTSRIWGGEDAVSGQFPYVVSVRVNNAHICGGSIIGDTKILTAAHCVVNEDGTAMDIKQLSIRAGSVNQFSGGKVHAVSAVHVHPAYNDIVNDVAVLTLKVKLELSDKIGIVEIATTAEDDPAPADPVKVAGWGEQSSGATPFRLSATSFPVATEEACKNSYKDADASVICIAHSLKEGSCYGDAGNGAVFNNKLVAVNNFVVGACGSRYADVYARVSFYAKWIESVMA